jgi:hypothetical protein
MYFLNSRSLEVLKYEIYSHSNNFETTALNASMYTDIIANKLYEISNYMEQKTANSHPFKKSFSVCKTHAYITLFTTACHWSQI